MTNPLQFRNLHDENDIPLLVEMNASSRVADAIPEEITVEAMTDTLAHMDGLTPQEGVIIASLDGKDVGYSRLGWYSSRPETCLYYQVSFLRQEYRQSDLWPQIVANNERALREIAASHNPVKERFYQGWASENLKDWKAALQARDFKVVRRFNNMIYTLGEVPVRELPAGLEVRLIGAGQMRAVWEAQKEMNDGLFENVAEDWTEDKYPEWLANPENNPRCWQVAWAGDQLAGMVLAHFDEKANEEEGRQHGYTEHIYVRPAWRGRGLASALIARALQALKDNGITTAELGVDSENESAAFHLYESLGYKTYSVDTWFRKVMEG